MDGVDWFEEHYRELAHADAIDVFPHDPGEGPVTDHHHGDEVDDKVIGAVATDDAALLLGDRAPYDQIHERLDDAAQKPDQHRDPILDHHHNRSAEVTSVDGVIGEHSLSRVQALLDERERNYRAATAGTLQGTRRTKLRAKGQGGPTMVVNAGHIHWLGHGKLNDSGHYWRQSGCASRIRLSEPGFGFGSRWRRSH